MMTFFSSTLGKIAVGAIMLLALGGMAIYIINTLESAGENKVDAAVNAATVKDIEKAQQDKAKADDKTKTTPYTDRVNGL